MKAEVSPAAMHDGSISYWGHPLAKAALPAVAMGAPAAADALPGAMTLAALPTATTSVAGSLTVVVAAGPVSSATSTMGAPAVASAPVAMMVAAKSQQGSVTAHHD